MSSIATEPRRRDTLGSFDEIAAAAVRSCGLDDFGAGDYQEGFSLLVEDMASNAGLTGEGNYAQRQLIKSALMSRLIAEQAFKDNPSYREVTIKRPLFVVGLPRTGTTALHRLLDADAGVQGLDLWLTEVPMPRPPRETWSENPIFAGLDAMYRQHHVENPEFMGIHYIDAGAVEECWRVLRQQGKSIGFESLAYLPDYSAWLRGTDWTDAYERHRANLQLIGLNDQDKRWVLKNPSHLVALDAIMEVYPDALIVQTHRDPTVAVASACSLSAEATKGWSTTFVGATIGQAQLDMLSDAAHRFSHARSKYDPSQFIDVDYQEFVANPLVTVQGIYQAFGLAWTEKMHHAVSTINEQSRRDHRKPQHHYDLADYGLRPEQVREAFIE